MGRTAVEGSYPRWPGVAIGRRAPLDSIANVLLIVALDKQQLTQGRASGAAQAQESVRQARAPLLELFPTRELLQQ